MGGVLLNSDDVPVLRDMVKDHKRKRRNNPQVKRKRWPAGGGGGGLQVIRALVQSVDCFGNVEGLVLSRPCNVTKVKGESDAGIVTITDRTEAFIYDATIIGKQVYAAYLESGYEGTGSSTPSDEECAWEVFQVCDPQTIDLCEPPDPFPSTVDMVSPTGTHICPPSNVTKTLDYVSDDGCIATYYLTQTTTDVFGDDTVKEYTILMGCEDGVEYMHFLYENNYHATDPPTYTYQTWKNNVSFAFGDGTVVLTDDVGTCGSAPSTHAATVTVNW